MQLITDQEDDMEQFLDIFIPAALAFGFVRLCMAQIFWIWKLGLNSLAGFAALWLLNLISGYTGIFFPMNLLTACIAGFLGLPGIAVLALIQIIP